MNTLEVIHTSFHLTSLSLRPQNSFYNRRKSTLCFCNSDEAESGSSPSSKGDKRKQEFLAQIAMLQAQKVRLTNFLDERATYLTQFAEDANTEFDQIGKNALKELEEASARIMANLENQAQAFEESAEINRQEIEKNEKVLEEFEDQITRDRNEGLFFKNLSQRSPKRAEAKLETQKLRETTKRTAGSEIRRGIYLVLISLLIITISNALFDTSQVEWRKVAALGLILVGLLAQYSYEKSLSSQTEESDKKEESN